MTEVTTEIAVYDGKYTFQKHEGDWRVHVLRHGEPWLVIEAGCNAVSQLMYECEELREKLQAQPLSPSEQEIVRAEIAEGSRRLAEDYAAQHMKRADAAGARVQELEALLDRIVYKCSDYDQELCEAEAMTGTGEWPVMEGKQKAGVEIERMIETSGYRAKERPEGT